MQVQTANRNASRELQRGFFAPLLIFPSSLSTSFLKNGTLRAFLHSHYLPWLSYPPPPLHLDTPSYVVHSDLTPRRQQKQKQLFRIFPIKLIFPLLVIIVFVPVLAHLRCECKEEAKDGACGKCALLQICAPPWRKEPTSLYLVFVRIFEHRTRRTDKGEDY